jgi:hypothetical protein
LNRTHSRPAQIAAPAFGTTGKYYLAASVTLPERHTSCVNAPEIADSPRQQNVSERWQTFC